MFAGGFNDLVHNFIAGVPLIFGKLLINWLKKRKISLVPSKQILCIHIFSISICTVSYIATVWPAVLCRDV